MYFILTIIILADMISSEFLILILISAGFLVTSGWVFFLHLRINRLTRGSHGSSLEKIFTETLRQVESLSKQAQTLESHSARRDQEFMNSLQGIGFIRFNPFGDTGGQQSFACAMIDHHGTGIILSSLYAREKMRMFAKTVTKGIPEQELSTEENQALKQAQERLTV